VTAQTEAQPCLYTQIIVRTIQNNFDRQCRRMDRMAKELAGDKKAKQIRADMLTRQKILSAQWDEANKPKPVRHARRFERRVRESQQDDPEPINNPNMILGNANVVKKHREDYDDGRIPRFMDTIKNSKGTEVSQEERATLLAMGATISQGDANAEEVAIATFQPPHWTSMLTKEWQLKEKEAEAEEAKRPHTARNRDGAPHHSWSRAGTRDAAGLPPRGSQTARPSTAHIVASGRASRPGTAAGAGAVRRPGTAAAASAREPITLEAAEVSAVQAMRKLHHSVQHVFEETPIAFHGAAKSDASVRHEEASTTSPALPEDAQCEATCNHTESLMKTPRLQARTPSHFDIGGMQVKASSVVLPAKLPAKRQLYHEQNKHRDSPNAREGHHTDYIPVNRWNPASALGNYHPFLDNQNLRRPLFTVPQIKPPGPRTASAFVQAESVNSTTAQDAEEEAPLSSGPMHDRGFSRITPRRSNASSGVRLKVQLSLPKTNPAGSRPPSARSPRPWSSREQSPSGNTPRSPKTPVARTMSEEERDALIEESRRVLAREVREQDVLSGAAASVPYSGRLGAAKGERLVYATLS